MANAFGNVWSQYRRGYGQKYGGPMPVSQDPSVGAPVGAKQYPTISHAEPGMAEAMAALERRAAANEAAQNVPVDKLANATLLGVPDWWYRTLGQDPGWQQINKRLESDPFYQGPLETGYRGEDRSTGENTLFVPTGGRPFVPTSPPPERVQPGEAQPEPLPGQTPFMGAPLGSDSQPSGEEVDTPPSEVYDPSLHVPGGPPAGFTPSPQDIANAQPIQLPRVAVTGQPQVRRAQPVLYQPSVVPRAQPVLQPSGAFTYPQTQTAAQPNLAQRFLQTLGHFFSGTLGQNAPATQPAGQTPFGYSTYDPTSGMWFSPSPGPGQTGYVTGIGQGGFGNVAPRALSTAGAVPNWSTPEAEENWVTTGQGPPFVGQPIGGYSGGMGGSLAQYFQRLFGWQGGGQPQQTQANQQPADLPVSPTGELSQANTGPLAASGGGEPQSRYEMGPFNAGLTNIGGMAGAGGSVAGGLAPAQSAISSLSGDIGKGGGGGAGGGGGGGGMGAGGSGLSGGQLASGISGILSSFGNVVAKANAPVSVNPAEWANPPPQPATFTFPALSPNTGGVWYS